MAVRQRRYTDSIRNGHRQVRRSQRNEYVYGNAAHQLEEYPERKRRIRPRRKRRVYPAPKPVALPSIGFGSFMLLFAAVAITVTVCFMYLRVQSGITNMKNDVVGLQTEIAQLREQNIEQRQAVLDSVDLSEIYELATEKLGMVQAVNNRVYKYHNQKSDMVRQYGDIPAEKK